MTSEIAISWHKDDIQTYSRANLNRYLSDEDTGTVLESLDEDHDACTGINWETIETTIEQSY